jgi:hypothetical protein
MKIKYLLEKDGKKWVVVIEEEKKEVLQLLLNFGFVIKKQEQWIKRDKKEE